MIWEPWTKAEQVALHTRLREQADGRGGAVRCCAVLCGADRQTDKKLNSGNVELAKQFKAWIFRTTMLTDANKQKGA